MSFLVDPTAVVNFNRTDDELELWWLFSAVAAGKTAKTQARLLDKFLHGLPPLRPHKASSPFSRIGGALADDILLERLKTSGLGQYNRLYRQFSESLLLDLRTCTVEDLEAIYGCGPKTARMFLMMSRPDQRYAALDTHVLKFLASKGFDVPKATPPAGARYRQLEQEFVRLADESGMSVADFDLSIWKSYARGSGNRKAKQHRPDLHGCYADAPQQ
jgi:hypothetical protein